jgi:MYXO-CTERM domain-containing protein
MLLPAPSRLLSLVPIFAVLAACSAAHLGDSPPPSGAPAPAVHASRVGAHAFHESDAGFSLTAGRARVDVSRDARLRVSNGTSGTSSFGLETVAFGRGAPGAASPTAARLDRDGSVIAVRATARERVAPRAGGIEQRWELDARPEGGGDLVVRVRPNGAVFEGPSQEGLRFADKNGATHYRYEHATWVDATGARTSLALRLAGDGDIELRVPARIVDESAYPATLDPILGVEFELEDPLFVPSTNSGLPSVASDGTNYLVTWAATGGIYAARVDSTGALAQPARITVSGGGSTPRVVWDGTEWFIAWTNGGVVYDARVASNGTLIDTTPQTIPSSSAGTVDVASDGSHVFLVWDQSTGQYTSSVQGVLLTPGAAPGTPQALSTAPIAQKAPRVVYDGIEYFAVWEDARGSSNIYTQTWDIYAARISTGGVLVDASGIAISTAAGNQTTPAVATNKTNVFITWIDLGAGSGPWKLDGARFASATGLIDGPAATGGIVLDTNYDYMPSIAYDGEQYVVAWWSIPGGTGSTTAFLTQRVSTSGALVGGQTTVYSLSGYSYDSMMIGGSASGSLVAWTKGNQILYGNRLDQGGDLLDGASPNGGFTLSEEPSTKSNQAVAYNGTNYLVVWSDNRGGPGVGSIYATRVDAGGTVLDSPAFPIATGRVPTSLDGIYVASNGSGWAVGWSEGGSSFVRIVGPGGSLINGPASADGIALTTTGYYGGMALASDGTDYLCVWTDGRGAPSNTQYINLYGMRFSATAQVFPATGSTDGSFAVATGNYEVGPSLGFDGKDYLLAWYDGGVHNQGAGARLTPTGQRVDGTVGGGGFSLPAAFSYGALLAFNGTQYIAASATYVDMVVPPNGAVAQSTPTLSSPDSAVYDGNSFWVFDTGGGTRIRDDASVVDTTLVGDSAYTYDPKAATDGHGVILAVYPVGTDLRARVIIDDDPSGASCAVGDYCASGVCEDGVCCDHACGGSTTDCQACTVAAGGSKDGTCTIAVAAHVCRPGDACELAGTCDGTTTVCPPAYYLPPNTVCGDAGSCTAAPLCAGTSDTCEPGVPVQNGTACGSGGVCNGGTCDIPVIDAGSDGGNDAGRDAGPGADSGAPEAGAPDAGGPSDAGGDASEDGGTADSGAGDASPRDAQSETGPTPPDDGGGRADSGSDAASPEEDSGSDASSSLGDGGPADAASDGEVATEAGTGPAGESSGCSCRAAPQQPGQGWLAGFAGIGLLAWRRRARRAKAGISGRCRSSA